MQRYDTGAFETALCLTFNQSRCVFAFNITYLYFLVRIYSRELCVYRIQAIYLFVALSYVSLGMFTFTCITLVPVCSLLCVASGHFTSNSLNFKILTLIIFFSIGFLRHVKTAIGDIMWIFLPRHYASCTINFDSDI